MALSFLYRLIRRVIEVVRVHRMDAAAKETEILVLRYQLAVLHRQVGRPHFTWSDRALVAFLAGLVPRERWRSFLVSPETILGWHRSLVRRRWNYPVLSENSNLASCRQLVLMDESAQPVVSTYPSWMATVMPVPTVRSSYHL